MGEQAFDTKNKFELSRSVSIVFADSSGNPKQIKASEDGNLPKTIEVLRVGMWRTPYHGDIMISPDDLQEYVKNFDDGVARADNGKLGLPINFAHESWQKAAGWMNRIYVKGDSLMADVEWTEAGREGLLSGEWKCISPEFCPAGRGGWCDPLDEDTYIPNVLEGAALTNIPLFRNMKPIMASAAFSKDASDRKVFLITASQSKKEQETMTLEDVLAKENNALTEDERTFLAENKDKLTAEQQAKFGFEVSQEANDDNKNDNDNEEEKEDMQEEQTPVMQPEDANVLASIKKGESVVIETSALKQLQDTAEDYRRDKATEIVKAHAARGAIKADQISVWADKLVKSQGKDRADLETLLTNLPSNEAIEADTKGSDVGAGEVVAAEEVKKRANELIEASAKTGKALSFGEAASKVLHDDPALAESYYSHN